MKTPLARPVLPTLLFALILAGCGGGGSSGLQPQIAASAEVLQPGDAGYESALDDELRRFEDEQ